MEKKMKLYFDKLKKLARDGRGVGYKLTTAARLYRAGTADVDKDLMKIIKSMEQNKK